VRLVVGLLRGLAGSEDTRTTLAGLVAAAVIASSVDLDRLLAGDAVSIAHAISAILVAVLGYFATRKNADGTTTSLGAAAGALYAVAGDVSSLITGMVLFITGYFTNKKPKE